MKIKTKEDMYTLTNSTHFVIGELVKLLNKEIAKYQKTPYPTKVMTTNNFIKNNLKRGVIPRELRGGKRK